MAAAFHEVRDVLLAGLTPFVFFDEFDSPCDNKPLGWLRYFLAPMQDAAFRDGHGVHPLGRPIFVFAGGTRHSFEEFERNSPHGGEACDPETAAKREREAHDAFVQAKGPDFVSRLRGFINIMGPDRRAMDTDRDDAYIIRRAGALRYQLETNRAAEMLINHGKRIAIDDCVLRAFLKVSKYTHGNRSIGAIIQMSRLAGKRHFDLSCLPPADQLQLHVDAAEFMFHARCERFLTSLRPDELPT